jgi:hypothetical protein
MSQAQISQAPAPGEKGAPVYTREELETKLRRLNEKLSTVFRKLELFRELVEIPSDLYYSLLVDIDTAEYIGRKICHLVDEIYDLIDAIIVRALNLDVDIDKYERQYNVKFTYETERQLGVALVKEDDKVRPVVVWTDYETIGYYEGEKI